MSSAADHLFRFKVGEFVTTVTPYSGVQAAGLELTDRRVALQILERLLQECPGGTQVHYKVRPHFMEIGYDKSAVMSRPVDWKDWAGRDVIQFNEIELEAYEAHENTTTTKGD